MDTAYAESVQAPQREVRFVTVHGHRRAYIQAGSGPALLLLHGLGCDHSTWAAVFDDLARDFTVIAPDLLGHGASDKPRADYSVGGYANGMRDLLAVLGIDRVTLVGHSLGGGVAMQFGYQYPHLVERMILVGPGGFGAEVTPLLRLVATPGFPQAMSVLTLPGLRHLGVAGLETLAKLPTKHTRDLDQVAAIFDSFKDPATRAAIAHVVRAVVDWQGQVISVADRAYLSDGFPTCIIWGSEDAVIPASHADAAADVLPHARVEVIGNSGHFPHLDHPERFAKVVRDFVRHTPAARFDADHWTQTLRNAATGAAGAAPVASLLA
ncbi:MAG: alpha/beta fold hydrolase [Nocardioides sp.]